MTEPVVLRTERLVLRPWTDADREPFAAMGRDPEVMRYFPAMIDRAASDAFVDRCMQRFTEHGWGLWVVDRGGFRGFTGLSPAPPTVPCAPAVEVGWRLVRDAWGQGYATEAGRAALSYGFDVLGLDEIVSFTATTNRPSIAVMQRLGMTRDPAEDFEHPAVPLGHPVRRHVLYRLRREAGPPESRPRFVGEAGLSAAERRTPHCQARVARRYPWRP